MSLLTAVKGKVTRGCKPGSTAAAHAFPPHLQDFPSLRGSVSRDSPCHGQRWYGDIFVTGPLPVLSLQGSHPSTAIIRGLQVTSANYPRLRPPHGAYVELGLFTFLKVQLVPWT